MHLKLLTEPSAGTGLVEHMRITQDGNVGIGTTTPGAKLEIAGQIKITGGSPGAGKVLQSDAEGLASWTVLGGSESTSVSNIGVAGVGIFKHMNGADIELKNINTAGSPITVTNDASNNEIDIGINQANSSTSGFLSSADWTAFNSKLTTITGAMVNTSLGFTPQAAGNYLTAAAGVVGTTELANDSVTYAKLQDISTNNRLLGRSTAGAGNAEEIVVGSGLSLASGTLSATATTSGASSVNIVTFTSSGTYTPSTGTLFIEVMVQGGGGGGGGGKASGVSLEQAPGCGGGAGGLAVKAVNSPTGSYTVTIGSGGSAGSNTGGVGGNGGTSSFAGGSVSVSATGGAGGGGTTVAESSPGAYCRTGDAGSGTGGDYQIRTSSQQWTRFQSGIWTNLGGFDGMSSHFGIGGGYVGSDANGVSAPAGSYGAGGSGGWSSSGQTVGRSGGAGASGIIIVKEYRN